MAHQLIDVHSHPLLPAYRRALAGGSTSNEVVDGMPLPLWSSRHHLETMDANGIDVCILSLPEAMHRLDAAHATALARAMNEELAAMVADHTSRFGAFAALPVHDMDVALAETAYALDVLKLDGVAIDSNHAGLYLGDAHYEPLLAELDRRGSTLFVHPAPSPSFDAKTSRINVAVLEFMFDTTRMITTMVLSGARKRYPKVRIIATHAGGTIPYLAGRIGLISQMPWAFADAPPLTSKDVHEGLASFHFDLTASTSATSLDALRQLVGVERLVMGFDFPFMPATTIAPALQGLRVYPNFTEVEKAKIGTGNALALFPRLGRTSPLPTH